MGPMMILGCVWFVTILVTAAAGDLPELVDDLTSFVIANAIEVDSDTSRQLRLNDDSEQLRFNGAFGSPHIGDVIQHGPPEEGNPNMASLTGTSLTGTSLTGKLATRRRLGMMPALAEPTAREKEVDPMLKENSKLGVAAVVVSCAIVVMATVSMSVVIYSARRGKKSKKTSLKFESEEEFNRYLAEQGYTPDTYPGGNPWESSSDGSISNSGDEDSDWLASDHEGGEGEGLSDVDDDTLVKGSSIWDASRNCQFQDEDETSNTEASKSYSDISGWYDSQPDINK